MTQKLRFSDIFEDKESHKTILKIGIMLLLSMEMIIYLVANSHSGSEPWVNIYDSKGQRIYEAEGNVLTPYEKLVFQETYGPLNNYQVRIETRSTPFPFRAWLAVAVGAPIGFMLLLTYLVRAYLSFVEGEQEEDTNNFEFLKDNSGKFRPWSNWQRLSLFHFGFLILVGVLSFWLVPDFVADITSRAISLIAKYKWFFLGVFVFSASLLIWVIYLKYKIAERMMDRQMDLEKFRVEKQLLLEQNSRLALPVPDAPSPLKPGQTNGGNVEQ
jgi:hypothetical protein